MNNWTPGQFYKVLSSGWTMVGPWGNSVYEGISYALKLRAELKTEIEWARRDKNREFIYNLSTNSNANIIYGANWKNGRGYFNSQTVDNISLGLYHVKCPGPLAPASPSLQSCMKNKISLMKNKLRFIPRVSAILFACKDDHKCNEDVIFVRATWLRRHP